MPPVRKRALIGAGIAALFLLVFAYIARNTACHLDERPPWCAWVGQNRLPAR
jgi:hypothetical protein